MSDPPEGLNRYKPFPRFSDWLGQAADFTDIPTVERIVSDLSTQSPELHRIALDRVRNVAALETGAIEDLYPSDRGLTITAATSAAILDAVKIARGDKVHAYVADALDSYQLVLDFSTGRQPIAAAWIRQLHTSICRSQETYRAWIAEDRFEDRPLPKGEFKQLPNHVRIADGSVHFYAEPAETEREANRFIEELRLSAFEAAHPVDQASYAHYVIAAIHPFTDGNGRIARAFASLFTYRAYSLPLLIYAVQRDRYFSALRNADEGNFLPLKLFIEASVLRAARILQQAFRSASVPLPIDALQAATKMYATSGGFLQAEVDSKAIELIGIMFAALQERVTLLNKRTRQTDDKRGSIVLRAATQGGDWKPIRSDHRRPVAAHRNRTVLLSGSSSAPADAKVSTTVGVSLPHDAVANSVFVLDTPTKDYVEIALGEFMDGSTLDAEMLIALFADRLVTQMLEKLTADGKAALKSKGYT